MKTIQPPFVSSQTVTFNHENPGWPTRELLRIDFKLGAFREISVGLSVLLI